MVSDDRELWIGLFNEAVKNLRELCASGENERPCMFYLMMMEEHGMALMNLEGCIDVLAPALDNFKEVMDYKLHVWNEVLGENATEMMKGWWDGEIWFDQVDWATYGMIQHIMEQCGAKFGA